MLDSDDNDRPQRRSALVAKELSRLDIDIAALSEVRFAEEGSLVEHGAGYTLFWSGRGKDEPRHSGVGFMLKNAIANRLHTPPTGHSDRIMSMRLPIHGDKFLTLVSVYSPTLQADTAVKEAFYSDLHTVITRTDPKDKLIILGDFNARVGRDFQLWKGVLAKHGLGNCNDNGRLLLQFCSQHQLTITNSLFQQQDRFKTTWRHPRSKHWHILDYILVGQRDARDVLHTRVMPSADCYTDHRLMRAKLAFTFKPPPKKKGPQTKTLQVNRLHQPDIKAAFQAKLTERLQLPPNPDPVTQWQDFKTAVQETAAETLGFSARKHRDWFDESDPAIQELLDKKRSSYNHLLSKPDDPAAKAAYRGACSTLQASLRTMQNDWWVAMAEKTQLYADIGDIRSFYEALKAIYGPSYQTQAPLLSADRTTLHTDKESIMTRWAEHFGGLFSDQRIVSDHSIEKIPTVETKHELDEPPTEEEIETAIGQMKPRKSPGSDGIPAEIYQHGGEVVVGRLRDLFTSCWAQGVLPQDLKDAVIVSLYKNKGEKSDCSNYRGITLLSIAGKVLARVLLNRLIPSIIEDFTPESQCGFRANRGTTDMIFVLRQIQEKCREQNKGLFVAFIDLTKAFDTVSRDGLWKILARLGCPPKFLTIIRQLHEGQRGQVKHNGALSDSFPISNGVKQGCVLAPSLFSIFFSMMLHQAKEDIQDGIYIRFRSDGSLFNLRRLLAHTKTTEQLITELLFADDCALLAHTEAALQNLVDHFSEASKAFGLTISLKKTEVLFQPAPSQNYTPPHITVDGTTLNPVEHFTYLGSVMSNDATIDKDLDNRLSKASSSFGRLSKRVWKNHSLKLSTKIKVYRAVVIPTLMYGAETWTLYRRQVRLLERFHQRCLRSIMNIKWHDYISNEDVLEEAQLPSIESILLKHQLRWAGHVARMDDSRMPKAVLFGELKSGKRNLGAPKKRFKDQLKKQLSQADIPLSSWQAEATDRLAWRSTIQKASREFEYQRSGAARDKRQRQKDRALSQNPVSPSAAFTCPQCRRVCASRIGLFSHQRACNPPNLP